MTKVKSLFSSKGKTTAAASISNVFDELVVEKLNAKARTILADFVRKDDERLSGIAQLNKGVKELEAEKDVLVAKLSAAQKVTNQAALTRKIAEADADIMVTVAAVTEIETLRAAATSKREAFIAAFDEDAYAALINEDLIPQAKLITA